MPDCEICGKTTEELYLISLEGSKLSVCENCSNSGKMLGKVREAPVKKEIIITQEAPEQEIINDYGAIIANRREKAGMTQEEFAKKINESISVIKKIEAEKLTPSDKTCEKIEKTLKIKLYNMVKRESMEVKKKNTTLTLEDIVKIKRKEKN